jgi:hypothetical protein
VHIGTSSTNLIGLQNAANNAAELYDIQGSQVGAGGDGDTHIAYATTPGIVFFGTTTAGSATITNVSSVANMQVGYTVTGPYLPSGEKIVSFTTSPIPSPSPPARGSQYGRPARRCTPAAASAPCRRRC